MEKTKPLKPEEVFESVVQAVQKTFADHPNTQIHRRYRIPNNSGRKREIDILIETTVNRINLKVAIECKDLKRKVSVTQVEAFKGKCDRMPGINKMIMVSRSGYQVDAINAANEFGMEIHRLEQISEESVKSWFRLDLFRVGEVVSNLASLKIQFLTKAPEITMTPYDLIYPPDSKDGFSIMDFVARHVAAENRRIHVIQIDPEKSEGIPEKYLTISCPNFSIQHDGILYPISAVHATVVYTHRLKKSTLAINSYVLPDDPLNPTETVTIIDEDNTALTLVNRKEDKGIDVFFSNKKDSAFYVNIKVEKKE